MPRVMSEKGAEFLADLPPQLRQDPDIKAVQDVFGREITRFNDTMDRVFRGFFPQLDTDGEFLSIWETQLQLSVDPVGYTTSQRIDRILTFIAKLFTGGSGREFEELMNTFIGGPWIYEEHSSKSLTNYVTNPSLETNMTGYVASSFTPVIFARAALNPYSGTYALHLQTVPPNGLNGTDVITPTPGLPAYLTPGASYTFRQHAFVITTNNGEIIPTIKWYDASGSLISTSTATYTNNLAGARILEVTGVAPPTAATAVLLTKWMGAIGTYTTVDVCIDASQFALTNLEDYFDGSVAGFFWNGTAHASTSSKTTPDDNEILITIPYASGGLRTADILAFARQIVDAHIKINVRYDEGFIVGLSELTNDSL